MRGWLGSIIAAAAWAGIAQWAAASGIFTCVDAKGHRLTADRPIVECLDREQTELGPTGQVLRRIGPSLTAQERAVEEEKAKRAAEERNRQLEEKKRDRALLARYPDKSVHDRERATALAAVDEVIKTARARTAELQGQRAKLERELEFYKGDAAKTPPLLRRQVEDNEHALAAQGRFIANQEDEKKRVNLRFDQELARLKVLWAEHAAASATAPASARK